MFYIEWVEQFWQEFWKKEGDRIERARRSDVGSLASDRRLFLALALRNLCADIASMPALNSWMLRFGSKYPDLRGIWARQLVDEQKALDAMELKLKKAGGDVWSHELNPFFKEGWRMISEAKDLIEVVAFGIVFEREHYLHHVNLGKAALKNGDLELGLPYMEILAPDEYRHCTMIYSYIISKYLSGPDQKDQLAEKLKEYAGLLVKDAEDYGEFLQARA
jgi:hypothetical protein